MGCYPPASLTRVGVVVVVDLPFTLHPTFSFRNLVCQTKCKMKDATAGTCRKKNNRHVLHLIYNTHLTPSTPPPLFARFPTSLPYRSKSPPLFARFPNSALSPLQVSSTVCFPTPLSHRSKSPPLYARLPSSALSPLQVSSAICPLTPPTSTTPLLARLTGHIHSLTPHFPRSRPQLRSIIPQPRPAVERRTQLQRARGTGVTHRLSTHTHAL